MESKRKHESSPPVVDVDESEGQIQEGAGFVNASGHVQEIDRTFGIFSICSIGIMSDNAWASGGGALVVSLADGGGPGVMYGLLASVLFYSLITLGLAELASAMPSSANVYTWASITAGLKYGRVVSFYAGWWNCLAWIFGVASTCLFTSQTVIAMYSLYHLHYEPQHWQYFIVYVVVAWLDLAIVLFGQRILARTARAMGSAVMLICFVTTMVCAIMPSQTGNGYATSSFVWKDFENRTGWSSDGLVFVMGILNGAYAIGTPDGVCHLCEEIPKPKKNIPWGMLCQMTTGSISTFLFYIAILYGITDLNAVFETRITALPLAAIFQQAVPSTGATFALLFLFLIDLLFNSPAGYVSCGRMLWTLARDEAVPFSHVLRRIDPKWRNPFYAQLVCGCCVTILGAIYVGNATAFTAFAGCFTIFTTWSYCAALLPHLLSRRRYVIPGPFWMSAWVAYPVIATACAYILVFNVLYMFPYIYPVTSKTINYACVMSGGTTLLLTALFIWKRSRGYVGPKAAFGAHDDIVTGIVGLTWEEETKMRRARVDRAKG